MAGCRCRAVGVLLVLAIAIVLGLARQFFRSSIDYVVPDLAGKVFLVTGCTSGIGLETASELASAGATVIMANRNVDKARRLQPAGKVEHRVLDLSSFASVRLFANGVLASGTQLDAIIMNAATTADHQTSVDGIDLQYQVNHLSPFLAANLLLPALAPSGRVVFVSSSMHFAGSVVKEAYDAEHLNLGAGRRSGPLLYSDTKLFNTMTAVELNARQHLLPAGAWAASVHPGFVQTALDEDSGGVVAAIVPLIRSVLARDARSGALTTLRLATDPALDRPSTGGRYFEDACVNDLCEGLEPAAAAKDPELRTWLWAESAKITGLDAHVN